MNRFRGPVWLDGLCVFIGILAIVSAFYRYGGPKGPKKKLFWLTVLQGALTAGLGLLGWF